QTVGARARVDPHVAGQRDRDPVALEVVIEAMRDRPELQRQHAEARLRALQADRDAASAFAALREAQLAELRPLKAAALRKLAEALVVCRPLVDALVEIESREEQI